MQYANAISVVNVSFPAGATTFDVAYAKEGIFTSNTDSTAYVLGNYGGAVYVWKKSGSGLTENTIILNQTLTGSVSVRAIEHNADTNHVFVATNDKFWRLSSSLGISGSVASGTANIVRSLIYDNSQNNMYYCTNDGYGELNTITLSPTTIYSDAGTNGVLGCAVDENNQIMYLVGDDIGATANCEIVKVALTSGTYINCLNTDPADSIMYNVCYSTFDNTIWTMSSSNSRVNKYSDNLVILANIAVGAIPRNCSISNDVGANRLYVNIESTDQVTIIDTEANVVISSHNVCNVGVTAPKLDTKRLFNVTNTYVACPEATNSVVIDNTVSEESGGGTTGQMTICYIVEGSGQQFCKTYDVDANGNVILDSVIGGVNPRNITDTSNDLFCSLGITDCDNTDITTNGTGMFMLLILIIISYAFVVAIHHFAHSPLSNINPMLVLLIGIVDITIAFFLGWIPDYIFYSVIVLLIGLGGFGLYRIIRGV